MSAESGLVNRIFTDKQKKHLYIAADGKCEKCGDVLSEDWEAHHIKRYADGGVTEIQNGMALCRACHLYIHRRSTSMSVIKPRGWQEKALPKFLASNTKSFLVEATPGAGKTIFSGLCAKELLDDGTITFVVIVVPTTALKGDKDAGFLGDWNKIGVDLTTVLKSKKPAPKDYHGAVVTYQQLPNLTATFDVWSRNGQRILFVFDEIHHASESNIWGSAAESCGNSAEKILCMSGTPFRGDGRRISFVRYDDDDRAIPDADYTYREAVRDRVCREVLFAHDDGVAEYVLKGELNEVRLSEADRENEGRAAATIFRRDSAWLETVLTKADNCLEGYRLSDVDAGGIVICRPGADENDDRHLHQVADLVKKVTGETPEVITHDDPDANAKIERFRKSNGGRWICAVRKISEGVDIKRLRVMVMATKPGTELLFRQMVGRVVRVDDPSKPQDATVYMARFPQLKEWAERIEDEAKAGISDQQNRKDEEEREKVQSDFSAIGSTHEDGGAVSSFGEQFSAREILQAEELKRGDLELADISVAKIAHLARKIGAVPPEDFAGTPKHERKLSLRKDINKLVQRVAYVLNPDKPNFQGVWLAIHKHAQVKNIDDLMDNHGIDKMEQVKELLKHLLAGGLDAA